MKIKPGVKVIDFSKRRTGEIKSVYSFPMRATVKWHNGDKDYFSFDKFKDRGEYLELVK